MALPDDLRFGRPIVEQLEIREFEPRPDAASDQRVGPRRACRLPPLRRHDMRGPHPIMHVSDVRAVHLIECGLGGEQLEDVAFVVMPHFVGRHAVPSAQRSRRQQEVDHGERCSLLAAVERAHTRGGAVDLGKVSALRMRRHPEHGDQMRGTWIH